MLDAHRVDFEIWTPPLKTRCPRARWRALNRAARCCGVSLTPDYIKECGNAGKLGARMTAVVVDADYGKEYRLPAQEEENAARRAADALPHAAGANSVWTAQ